MHILTLYLRLRREPGADVRTRTFIFSGKAAPGYFMAKRIIKLITAIGDMVNHDPVVRDRLKVVFFQISMSPTHSSFTQRQIFPSKFRPQARKRAAPVT